MKINFRHFVLLFILVLLPFGNAYGQESQVNRYFIYFADKADNNYPYSLSDPSSFLTQRAIERRTKQGIDIQESDLPVSPSYLSQLRSAGAEVFFSSRWLNGALVNADTSLISTLESLSFVDSIAWIAGGTSLSFEKTSWAAPDSFSDPLSISGDSDIQLKMLGADHMHSDSISGQGMLIAVLDNGFSGVDRYAPFQHIWEENRIIAFKDFVKNSGSVFSTGTHGTSVFSIIASKYDKENGYLYGIAPDASFILCTTEDNQAENTIEEYNWVLGAEFADSLGADVINTSLGYRLFDIPDHNYSFEDLDGETTVISRGAEMAANKGMIVVLSAGNEGNGSSYRNITAPADADGVLTVGSVDQFFERSSFSSIGNTFDGRIKPDVSAFGSATAVVQGNGRISRGSGTSYAAPLIAGFAAGVWQVNPDWTSKEVIRAIKNAGHRAYAPDSLIGYGVPSYTYAIDGKALNVADILKDKVTVYPNPFRGDTLYFLTKGEFDKGMNIKILDPNGKLVFQKDFKKRQIKNRMDIQFESQVKGVYFLFLETGDAQKIVKLINF